MNITELRDKTELLFNEYNAALEEIREIEQLKKELTSFDRLTSERRLLIDEKERDVARRENTLKKEKEYVTIQLRSMEERESKITKQLQDMERERIILSQMRNSSAELDSKVRELEKREKMIESLETAARDRKAVLDKREVKIRDLESHYARLEQLSDVRN